MRKIGFILTGLLFASSLFLVVSAHSGGTDSDGGHYDRSTGEYHYHHGYSAHDHYDVDGDGDIDCPYNFVDNSSRADSYGDSSGATESYSYDYYLGYHTGNQHGYEEGHEIGYDAGYEKGLSDAKAEIQKDVDLALDQERRSATFGTILLCALIGIPVSLYFHNVSIEKQRRALRNAHLEEMRKLRESVAPHGTHTGRKASK